MKRNGIFLIIVGMAVTGMALIGAVGLTGYPAQGAAYTVNTAAARVAGKSEKILTDGKGFALYYLTSDKPPASACTGGCARVWPPMVSTTAPTEPPSLKGKLAVTHTANGSQVSYNGHPLYRYAADTKPGQVNGNDKNGPSGGKWYVATPSLAASSSHSTSAGGGYPKYP